MFFRCASIGLIAASLTGTPAFARQGSAPDPLPFEALGKELLAGADAAAATPPARDAKFLDRLAPLHVRVELGALELWVPTRMLNAQGALEPGPKIADVAPAIAGLLELERTWTKRLLSGEASFDEASAALDQLVSWSKSLKRVAGPTGDDGARWVERVAAAHLLAGPAKRSDRLIVIDAPTRAQYIGLLGAAGIVDSGVRSKLWREDCRRMSGDALGDSVAITAVSLALRPDEHPLVGDAFEPAISAQWFVHAASHLLQVRLTPMAPSWWTEGLAVSDTIAATGADETLCSGYSSPIAVPVLGASEATKILVWVSRDVSPYRGAASMHWFGAALRKARTANGFQILDFATDKPAFEVRGPFLGEGFVVDRQVAGAGIGAKRGFAEFYRAYCAAFVHWLDTDEHADPTLLGVMCRELAKAPYDPRAKSSPLYEIARSITGLALGSVTDPKLDLEAAFAASLSR